MRRPFWINVFEASDGRQYLGSMRHASRALADESKLHAAPGASRLLYRLRVTPHANELRG